MDVEQAIVQMLTAPGPVADLIGARIAQAGMPQGLARPNIVYQRLSTRRTYSNDGPTRAPTAAFQLSCWAETTAAARGLADKVRAALDGFSGTVGTLVIDAIFLDDESDAPQPPASAGQDQRIRGVIFDARVHYQE